MAVKRYYPEEQAYGETLSVPRRYDAESSAYVDTTGKAYDPDAEAWEEKWNTLQNGGDIVDLMSIATWTYAHSQSSNNYNRTETGDITYNSEVYNQWYLEIGHSQVDGTNGSHSATSNWVYDNKKYKCNIQLKLVCSNSKETTFKIVDAKGNILFNEKITASTTTTKTYEDIEIESSEDNPIQFVLTVNTYNNWGASVTIFNTKKGA